MILFVGLAVQMVSPAKISSQKVISIVLDRNIIIT